MTTFDAPLPRDQAVRLGEEAVRIIDAGGYRAPSGRAVDIGDILARAVRGTIAYPPGVSPPVIHRNANSTRVEVENETTLSAARRLMAEGLRPAVLNFASATHPGGGFLDGARAQEEYLARSSGLYACLRDQPMYAFHRTRHDALYTDYVLYLPDVPVFRGDDGVLLDTLYPVSIISAPAVNAAALPTIRRNEALPAMQRRILKVLAVGAAHGHDSLVLGAWGCGAFGNDPAEIAPLFRCALREDFAGAFRHVVFAIADWSAEARFIGPFRDAF